MNKLKILKKLIQSYTTITSDIIGYYDKIDLPIINPVNVRLLFIKRFHFNSISVLKLIDDYYTDQNFKLPLFIILRSCISDFLTLKYIDKIIKDNADSQDIIENKIKGYLVDNIKYLIKELDYLCQNSIDSNEN
ncbi:MAG: hypothetical protein JXJ22_04295 [Bacteroidales bacterium]|nr:hypothetical protein [Bacteroidales bacterium]